MFKTRLESETTLNHKSPKLKDIIDYTEKGAGELSARSLDGDIYHSKEHISHKNIEIQSHSLNMSEFLRQIGNWLDRLF